MTTGKIDGIDDEGPGVRQPARCGSTRAGGRRPRCWATRSVEPSAVLATHLTEVVPPPCRRDSHARRDEAPGRRAEEDQPGRGRRADSQSDEAGRSAAGAADAAARASADPAARPDPGNARRLCRQTKDPVLLAEYVRHRLARTICTRYRDAEGRLYVLTLDPALEDRIRAGIEHTERGLFIRMSPQTIEKTLRADRRASCRS